MGPGRRKGQQREDKAGGQGMWQELDRSGSCLAAVTVQAEILGVKVPCP